LPSLRKYQAWNTQATDATLRILGGLESLEHVRLSRCALVTDAGVGELARLPRLTNLQLEQLPGVTVDGVGGFRPAVRIDYAPPR
jgi:hypothetical protein